MRTWIQDEAAAYNDAADGIKIDVDDTPLVVIKIRTMLRQEDAERLEQKIREQVSTGVIIAESLFDVIVIDKHGNVLKA